MKIIFDNEEEKIDFIGNVCPNHILPKLNRRCEKECHWTEKTGFERCIECWNKFDEFIELEVMA